MSVVKKVGNGLEEELEYLIVLKGTIVAPLSLPHRERVALRAALEEYDKVRQLGTQEAGQ